METGRVDMEDSTRSVPVRHGENVVHRSCVPGPHTMTLLFLSYSSKLSVPVCARSERYPAFLCSWSPDRHTPVGDWFLNYTGQ